MKLLQINVWQGRIARPLFELVQNEAPDIIFAQEIFSYPAPIPASSPWAYFGTLEQLSDRAGLPHTFFSPSSTFPMFGRTLSYGNAILSRYPLGETSTHYTAGPGPIHYDQPAVTDHNVTRNFQHAVIKPGNTELNLINHHGHWANQPLGDALSVQRLEQVSEYIAKLNGPVIVGGDLNLSPDSPALTQFIARTGLVSALAGTAVTSTLSAAHYVHGIICDHVLTSPELTIKQAGVSEKIVSDHKAVIVEFSV